VCVCVCVCVCVKMTDIILYLTKTTNLLCVMKGWTNKNVSNWQFVILLYQNEIPFTMYAIA